MKRIRSLLASLGFDSLRSLFDILPGCGFRPRDDELISFMKHKMDGNESEVELIPVVDICKHEPWEIPTLQEFYQINSKDPDWFFFSPIIHKYRDSKRVNRLTKTGYWKPTGQDRDVKNEDRDIIGRKKTLVFHEGRVPCGFKTNWVYHEYQLAYPLADKNPYVLCHLMKKIENVTKETSHLNFERGEPSDFMSCSLNNNGESSSNKSPDFAYPQDSPECLQIANDDYLDLMNNFTFPNESNTMPMLSETHDLGDFIPNFPNQYYNETLQPYTYSSSYGENQMVFTEPNSYSPIGGYGFTSF